MEKESFRKKWGFQVNAGSIFLILLCTAINLGGSHLAKSMSLPWWLDSVGTFISAVFLGPIAGAISGALMNVILAFSQPGQIWFCLVSICGGLAVGLFFPRDRKIDSFSMIATALFAGFVMTIVSTPLNLYFNDGMTGNEWGDALTIMLADYMNMKAFRCFCGGLLVNMPDKAISILITMFILQIYRRIRRRKETADQNTEKNAGKVNAKQAVKNGTVISAFLLAACACLLLSSQNAYAMADINSEYAPVLYGVGDGLASAEINAIAQTSDGYIWAGGYSGLYRYDGRRFEQFSPDQRINNVTVLFEDSAARLWIGTNDSGVACYDYETGKITFYTSSDGLSGDAIRSVCEDDNGNIYVSTTSYLCCICESGIRAFDEFADLRCIYSLKNLGNGRIMGVTQSGVLFVLRGEKLIFSQKNSDHDVTYTTAACDQNGGVMVGGTSDLLYRFRADDEKGLLPAGGFVVSGLNYVNAITYSEVAGGYLVSASKGLFLVGGKDLVADLSLEDFSLSVTDAITDMQGNFWFASSKQGVLKFSPSPFLQITKKVGMKETAVNALLPEIGKLYVGTDDGLYLMDLKTNELLSDDLTKKLKNTRIRHLMRDSRGNLWVSTYGVEGLCMQDRSGAIHVMGETLRGLLGSRFRFCMELSDGTILAASTDGLNFIKDDELTMTMSEKEGLTVPQVLTAVQMDDGTIMAGTDGGGIYLIKDGRVTGQIGHEQGLASQVVLKIIEIQGGRIFVTSTGLYYQAAQETACRKLDAFPYNNDYDIYIAGDGNAFVSSSAGIFVVKESALIADEGYEPVLLNASRGFTTTLTANAYNGVVGDNLYLCCSDGVFMLNTKNFNASDENYEIALSSVTEEAGDIPVRAGVYQIPAGNGRMRIMPAVLNFSISNPYISVQLVGVDEQPVLTHQNELRDLVYQRLPYGDHTLEIKVIDELTGEVKKERDFRFHKDAQLYEKTYYKVYLISVAAMLIGFLAWMFAKMGNMAIINRQYEQIRQAKEEAELANQAKSRFLANMSHEIRTPINAVLGMDEMILRESSEPDIRSYASDIYAAGNTLLALINDILDSSKIESGRMELQEEEYETAELLRNLKNMISQRAAEKDLTLIMDVDENMPSKLSGDDVRLRQVITNILTNAVKYTHEGSVTLHVSADRLKGEALLHVSVEDTGIGIKEEDLPKLFEAYRRIEEGRNRHIEGTGLGMNITVSILKMMGSRLQVESVYGKGSKFFFDVRQKIVDDAPMGPLTDLAKETGDSRAAYESGFTAPRAKVLVVDDNAMNRKVFCSLLKQTKIQITQAGSGQEALDIVNERLDGGDVFDMVFMDHMMPDMDGVETMQKMRTIAGYDKVPIYVLTANAVTGAREQYLADGFDGFLSKPIVSARLEAAILETLPKDLIEPGAKAAADPGGNAKGRNDEKGENGAGVENLPMIDGLDWDFAYLHLPDRQMLLESVKEFWETLSYQADKLDRMKENGDMEAYRIQVHGMKSSAATVGIVPLAGMAKVLENASRDGESEIVNDLHPTFMTKWREYEEKLSVLFCDDEENRRVGPDSDTGRDLSDFGNGQGENPVDAAEGQNTADSEMMIAMLTMLQTALEEFEVDEADSVMEKMLSFDFEPEMKDLVKNLNAAVKDLDTDGAGSIMERIRELL
ncbi:MAG: response regulator [Lachnospiraceae bacterium]|nr:response regulator [Lachnospiraceae bacterium]